MPIGSSTPRTASVRGVVVFGAAGVLLALVAAGLFFRFLAHRWWPVAVAQSTPLVGHQVDLMLMPIPANNDDWHHAQQVAHQRILASERLDEAREHVLLRLDRTSKLADRVALACIGLHHDCPPGPNAQRLWQHLRSLLGISDRWDLILIVSAMVDLAPKVEDPYSGLCEAWLAIVNHRRLSEVETLFADLTSELLRLPGDEPFNFLIDRLAADPSLVDELGDPLSARALTIDACVLWERFPCMPLWLSARFVELMSAQPGAYTTTLAGVQRDPRLVLSAITGFCQSTDIELSALLREDWLKWQALVAGQQNPAVTSAALILAGNHFDTAQAGFIRPHLTAPANTVRIQALRTWYMMHNEAAYTDVVAAWADAGADAAVRAEAERLLLLMDPARLSSDQAAFIATLREAQWVPDPGISPSPSREDPHDPRP